MAKTRSKAGGFILLLVVAAFVLGVGNLFSLRFEAGDSYPPYSSLRADPLGIKILYESLSGLAGITVRRNYQPLSRMEQHGNTTLFAAGAPFYLLSTLSPQDLQSIESFVLGGGRLVLLFYPAGDVSEANDHEAGSEKKKDPGKKEHDARPGREANTNNRSADDVRYQKFILSDRWKITMSWNGVSGPGQKRTVRALPAAGSGLTQPVSWHSTVSFTGSGAEWREVYELDGKPVMVERRYGKGSIVLASDSYFASNEAMLKERRPDLLAWLISGNRTVIFNETHLGIQERPGVAALLKKYRLEGLFAGLLLLAVLFVWRNSTSLVPARDDRFPPKDGMMTGRDSLAGLTGLLCRTIPRDEVLAVCVTEWKKARRGEDGGDAGSVESIVDDENRKPARERDAVAAYRSIQRLLGERKRMR
jgi:hypothetical protein